MAPPKVPEAEPLNASSPIRATPDEASSLPESLHHLLSLSLPLPQSQPPTTSPPFSFASIPATLSSIAAANHPQSPPPAARIPTYLHNPVPVSFPPASPAYLPQVVYPSRRSHPLRWKPTVTPKSEPIPCYRLRPLARRPPCPTFRRRLDLFPTTFLQAVGRPVQSAGLSAAYDSAASLPCLSLASFPSSNRFAAASRFGLCHGCELPTRLHDFFSR